MPSTISTITPRPDTLNEWGVDAPSKNRQYGTALSRVRDYVKSNPKKTLVTAAALGLVVVAGIIAKRRSR